MTSIESRISPPGEDEYASFYGRYIAPMLATPDLREELRAQPIRLRGMVLGSEESRLAPYEPGKWSVRQVIGHLIDLERVFAYRVLRFSRGDATPLSSFDHDLFVSAAEFDSRSVPSLLDELDLVRASTIALVDGLSVMALQRRGVASNVTVSARALVYTIAGHTSHHLELLDTRYGLVHR